MTNKIIAIVILIFVFALFGVIGYAVYIHNELEAYKTQVKKEKLIDQKNLIQQYDSLSSIQYKANQAILDSMKTVMDAKSSVIEGKIKKQDEKIRTLLIPSNNLPDL